VTTAPSASRGPSGQDGHDVAGGAAAAEQVGHDPHRPVGPREERREPVAEPIQAGLAVRVFDEKTKLVTYNKQTQGAQARGKSNCPLCALGENANKGRIYKLNEMDADHVSAWSKAGDSSAKNCQMLCITHNRAKGNR